jgi:hypothetical protein
MLLLLPIIVFNVKGTKKLKKKLDPLTLKLSEFLFTPIVIAFSFLHS